MKKTSNLLSHRVNGVPTNEDATEEMRRILGADAISYPKPPGLIQYLVRAISSGDDIVLDFFAGSGTTGAGVWRQDLEDGHHRRWILVQLPESLDEKDREHRVAVEFLDRQGKPRNLAELTKEYLRREGERVKEESPMFSADLGFRVFRLDSTNIREWDPRPSDLEGSLHTAVDSIKTDRKEGDLLFELLIKLGFDLCTPMESRRVLGKTIYSVGDGALMVCLDQTIMEDEIEELGLQLCAWKDELGYAGEITSVFRDCAFVNDVAKVNLTTLLRDNGVASVRSI